MSETRSRAGDPELKITPNYLQFAGDPGMVYFIVEGNPIPKARPVTRFRDDQPVRTFTPRRTQEYEARVAWAARQAMAGREPLAGELGVVLHFYRKDRSPCDFDNLAKAVLDAVQESRDVPGGIVFQDDRQIVHAYIMKSVDPARPRAEVWVWEIHEKGDAT